MADLCTVCLKMPSDETPKIQEGHELLGHIVCGLIEREMFPSQAAVQGAVRTVESSRGIV